MKSSQQLRTVILDIETDDDADFNPSVIWCVVAKDVDTNEVFVFRRPDLQPDGFRDFISRVSVVIGHNIINFDWPHLVRLVGDIGSPRIYDTLVVSRLLDFDIDGGHSLRAWGERLGCRKIEFNDYSHLTEEMVEYCIQDVEVTLLLYKRFLPYLSSRRWAGSIDTEHFVATELRQVRLNGFHFNVDKCRELLYNISREVEEFDKELLTAFPPKVELVREIHPKLTKFGTLNRSDFRWEQSGDLSEYNGGPFSRICFEPFNPGSPAQIVERLNEAGWKPTEKTKGHKKFLREIKRKKLTPEQKEKLAKFARQGWTVSEVNLDTLPDTAPAAAKTLAKRLKYAARTRTLNEWIEHYKEDGRIHGSINSIGAWTHRCSHDKPNTGNIPRDDAEFGVEMRSMWDVDEGYLVGVDAEGIQLRVLAHYINDERFTHAVTSGRKEDGTDPHSLNKQALGDVCKSRNDAKTFIYAWLLGAGREQVAHILECTLSEASQADEDFIKFYPGLKLLKAKQIPRDAVRGWFEGFDGRCIKIVGADADQREHFALAGYLQAGEAVIMKTAMGIWIPRLRRENVPFKLVNFVHDEWQTQVCADRDVAKYVANVQADSIREAGVRLGLRCPMAGSILSGHGDEAIGQNWYETH